MAKKSQNARKKLINFFESALKSGTIKNYSVPNMNKKSCGRFKVYKPIVDNIEFDSGLEAQYYVYLLEQISSGIVDNFKRQETFQLQPSFKINNKRIQSIKYIADFVITYVNGNVIVVDVKGRETPDFKIKKKLFEFKYRMPLYCVQLYNGQWHTLEEIKKLKRKP